MEEEQQTPLQSPPIHTHIHTEMQENNNNDDNNNMNNLRTSRTRYSSLVSTFRFLQAPLSSLVSHYFPVPQSPNFTFSNEIDVSSVDSGGPGGGPTEVSIEIMADQSDDRDGGGVLGGNGGAVVGEIGVSESDQVGGDEGESLIRSSGGPHQNVGSGGDESAQSSSSYEHRYDLQQAARLIERVIPFSFLLLLVFIRQHLQGIILIFMLVLLV